MLATGCPSLILYGRRRVGKSMVLRNLASFLPPAVRIAVVSMQDAKAFSTARVPTKWMLRCWSEPAIRQSSRATPCCGRLWNGNAGYPVRGSICADSGIGTYNPSPTTMKFTDP